MNDKTQTLVEKAVNRLAKWRSIFAGWQLGTRAIGDPESDAVRDHREATLIMRAEVSAITNLLIRKGVFTKEEFKTTLAQEADELSRVLSNKFPGMTATDLGISMKMPEAAETMKGWKP